MMHIHCTYILMIMLLLWCVQLWCIDLLIRQLFIRHRKTYSSGDDKGDLALDPWRIWRRYCTSWISLFMNVFSRHCKGINKSTVICLRRPGDILKCRQQRIAETFHRHPWRIQRTHIDLPQSWQIKSKLLQVFSCKCFTHEEKLLRTRSPWVGMQSDTDVLQSLWYSCLWGPWPLANRTREDAGTNCCGGAAQWIAELSETVCCRRVWLHRLYRPIIGYLLAAYWLLIGQLQLIWKDVRPKVATAWGYRDFGGFAPHRCRGHCKHTNPQP